MSVRVGHAPPGSSRPLTGRFQGESSPMLKPLTLSLGLALALGAASVSKAGGHGGGCDTCGLASPQSVVASPQCDTCAPACAPKKHCFSFHLPKIQLPKCTYT